MGGGCDGEGVREIDIEDGDLGSCAAPSVGGAGGGRHGQRGLWMDVGPKRNFAVHKGRRGWVRRRMQDRSDLSGGVRSAPVVQDKATRERG